ncbi:alkaline phosphatase family protein [Sphingobacterium sp.]|uniref:alkaline phosphatase family protein n=1 Tax=Sphingobacterium sp. TaxID=341027 RepID=UPI00289E50E1|nr:alkaline phosphatase family protein [Sphingobacterium sp.]
MMKINSYRILILVAIVALTAVTNSCKKYFDPPLVFEKEEPNTFTKDRKVLLISIDGLAGVELANYVPATIGKLLAHSKYTFESMADANTRDAAAWTTILSGKSSGKHGVNSNDFDVTDEDDDDIHDHEGSGVSTGYISLYQRFLESGRSLKTFSVTTWEPLDHNLFNLSDENGVVGSDEAVKTTAIERIKKGEDDLGFAVINFRDLNTEGVSGGFSMANPDYKTALDRIDAYIGEILTAVEQRKNYTGEDWLIIITSNHGGLDRSYGGATLEERKVPLIFYNPNFSKRQFITPAFTNGFKASNGINGTIPAVDASRYNLGTSGEYTIQLKLLVHQFGTLNPAIISKQGNTGNSDDGWSFIHNGGIGWRFKIKGTQVTFNKQFEAGKWYTLTARIYMDGSTRKVQVFTDGEMGAEGSLGTAQGTSSSNLNVGFSASYAGGSLVQSVKDVCIYNKALPIDYITGNYCKSPVDDQYKADMIGAWDLGDGIGARLKNGITGAPDFMVNGAYSWEFFQNDFCKLSTGSEKNPDELLLNAVDIAPQIFYWLNIKPAESWGLDGKVFLSEYETEFVGK